MNSSCRILTSNMAKMTPKTIHSYPPTYFSNIKYYWMLLNWLQNHNIFPEMLKIYSLILFAVRCRQCLHGFGHFYHSFLKLMKARINF